MSKDHTPGPWETEKHDTEFIEIYHDSILIADVLDVGPVDGKANAALIAAAPRLFEALERASRQLDIFEGEGLSHTGRTEAHNLVRAAIAAAKGEGDD